MLTGMFPEGLRVLVFDEDFQNLHSLENHLQDFRYKVTTCNEGAEAMSLLRNHLNKFDIAIVEAQNSAVDIFRLISEIASESNVPIIIISNDDSVQSVINWIKIGVCDYLIKPIRPEDLRLIFKHVVKKMRVGRVVESEDKAAPEKSSSVGDSTIRNPNKRKRSMFIDGQVGEKDQDHVRDSTTKKRRVVWDKELKKKFLDAVEELGPEAVPKKILERMNVVGMTRENVASHLQKHRMLLNKQKNQNEKDEKNRSLLSQQGEMYFGEGSSKFYGGSNMQFPTQHINNISQPLRHHHDGVSVAVSTSNLHHHQTSGFTCFKNVEESSIYNDIDAEVSNLVSFFTQKEEMSLSHLHEPMVATTLLSSDNQLFLNQQPMMNFHEPSILHTHSFPSSLAPSSSLDQNETTTMMNVGEGQQHWLLIEQEQPNLTDENRFFDN
ncbi:putative two-component response regulator-like APRR4 [Hirschfeldia incana]|nr:putative two-component response regulator-like APRR4 [Hirschfeldia incana]